MPDFERDIERDDVNNFVLSGAAVFFGGAVEGLALRLRSLSLPPLSARALLKGKE